MEGSTDAMRPQTGSLADAGWCWRSKALQDFGKSGYPVGHIYDIGGSRNPDLLKHNVCKAFTPDISGRQRSFPSELFFHGEGSAKWSQITEMLEFYQMRNEIELLEHHGGDIAKEIAPGSIVIDMGYGDNRKILPLLLHLEQLHIPIEYYALDLSLDSLQANMEALVSSPVRKFDFVRCFGLWGTFRDGFDLIDSIESPTVCEPQTTLWSIDGSWTKIGKS